MKLSRLILVVVLGLSVAKAEGKFKLGLLCIGRVLINPYLHTCNNHKNQVDVSAKDTPDHSAFVEALLQCLTDCSSLFSYCLSSQG